MPQFLQVRNSRVAEVGGSGSGSFMMQQENNHPGCRELKAWLQQEDVLPSSLLRLLAHLRRSASKLTHVAAGRPQFLAIWASSEVVWAPSQHSSWFFSSQGCLMTWKLTSPRESVEWAEWWHPKRYVRVLSPKICEYEFILQKGLCRYN